MSFWKKSEDPWDIDPDKRKPAREPEKAAPGLLASLRGEWDAMQAGRQEKRERLRLPPEKCRGAARIWSRAFSWAAGAFSGIAALPPEKPGGIPEVKISSE